MSTITQEDYDKLSALIENIDKFSGHGIGGTVGATASSAFSVRDLRKAAAVVNGQISSKSLTVESIHGLEAGLQAVVSVSPAGLPSYKTGSHINPDEISGVLDMLDSIAEKLEAGS